MGDKSMRSRGIYSFGLTNRYFFTQRFTQDAKSLANFFESRDFYDALLKFCNYLNKEHERYSEFNRYLIVHNEDAKKFRKKIDHLTHIVDLKKALGICIYEMGVNNNLEINYGVSPKNIEAINVVSLKYELIEGKIQVFQKKLQKVAKQTKDSCLKKIIKTILAATVSLLAGLTIGFVVGFILGSWSGPGAFLTGCLGALKGVSAFLAADVAAKATLGGTAGLTLLASGCALFKRNEIQAQAENMSDAAGRFLKSKRV